MPVLTINEDYDSYVNSNGTKSENSSSIYVAGTNGKYGPFRSCYRFPLTNLPAGATVTQVRLKLNITVAGGSAGLWDIRAYASNGQRDPAGDDGATQYADDISGNTYVTGDITWRAVSNTWIVLGGNVNSDVAAAKSAGTKFAISTQEEGDNDTTPTADGATTVPQLEITYTSGSVSAAGSVGLQASAAGIPTALGTVSAAGAIGLSALGAAAVTSGTISATGAIGVQASGAAAITSGTISANGAIGIANVGSTAITSGTISASGSISVSNVGVPTVTFGAITVNGNIGILGSGSASPISLTPVSASGAIGFQYVGSCLVAGYPISASGSFGIQAVGSESVLSGTVSAVGTVNVQYSSTNVIYSEFIGVKPTDTDEGLPVLRWQKAFWSGLKVSGTVKKKTNSSLILKGQLLHRETLFAGLQGTVLQKCMLKAEMRADCLKALNQKLPLTGVCLNRASLRASLSGATLRTVTLKARLRGRNSSLIALSLWALLDDDAD